MMSNNLTANDFIGDDEYLNGDEVELSDFEMKLTDDEKSTILEIKDWLKDNKSYRDSDFTEDFIQGNIFPLVRYVQTKEIEFSEGKIIKHLRIPWKDKDNKYEITNKLELEARELEWKKCSYTKGIDVTNEMLKYTTACVASLIKPFNFTNSSGSEFTHTTTVSNLLNRVSDIDLNILKKIYNLYFLG